MPETLRVSEQIEVPFVVRNTSDLPLCDVRIVATDDSLQIIPSEQNGGDSDNNESLSVGMIAPGESRMVKTFISGNTEGMLTRCFTVEYKEQPWRMVSASSIRQGHLSKLLSKAFPLSASK